MADIEKGREDVAVITHFVTIVWHSEWTLMNSSHGDVRYNLIVLQYHLQLDLQIQASKFIASLVAPPAPQSSGTGKSVGGTADSTAFHSA